MYLTNKKNLYIFCLFWDISRWRICFIHFILKDFREGGGGGGGQGGGRGVRRRLCNFFCWFAQGSLETVHFLGISSLGNWVKLLYFVQCLSSSLVFVSIFVICLFIYYYFYFLVGVNSTHPFLLMWAIVNLC